MIEPFADAEADWPPLAEAPEPKTFRLSMATTLDLVEPVKSLPLCFASPLLEEAPGVFNAALISAG